MDNITEIKFSCNYSSIFLYQWDTGQVLSFSDIPDGVEVQFEDGSIKVITDGQVTVPDAFLQTAGEKHAWLQCITADSETTFRLINILVKKRAKKDDYVPEDPQTFREWMQETMEATESIAQSVRDDADAGVFDGFSPTVSTSEIEGGHRVTITDKSGTHIVDVMNGAKGDKGDAGKIKFFVVTELPTEDIDDEAIYLLPIEGKTGDTFEEWIYVNGQWEKLGVPAVEIDLSDYVKNTDYATSNKGGVIKYGNYVNVDSLGTVQTETATTAQYEAANNKMFVGKGTLENILPSKVRSNAIFVSEYGVTPVSDVAAAVSDGKIVLLHNTDDTFLWLTKNEQGYFYFSTSYGTTITKTVYIDKTTGVYGTYSSFTLSRDISSHATLDTYIPSTKSVVDYVNSRIVTLTQSEYEALSVKNPTTLYLIVEDDNA